MEIKIEDYLSEEEIKDIVKQEVRQKVGNLLGSNTSSFINQLAKRLSLEQIQQLIPNFEELLNNHIKDQIESIKIESLFWESFGWKSNGNKIINKILAANESLIEAKIKQIFKT